MTVSHWRRIWRLPVGENPEKLVIQDRLIILFMPSNNVRDGFPAAVKKALAYRVSLQCSNPLCRRPTAAPHIKPNKYNLLGEAAHITGARPAGPRYDPAMSRAERRSISNGIWLCRNCARIIDTDEERFPPSLLRWWKQEAETALSEIYRVMERRAEPASDFLLELPSDLKRVVNPRFGFSFLAPENWERWEPQNNDGCSFSHPDEPRIEIRSWAGYAVLDLDIDSTVEAFMDYQRKQGYFELISTTDATRSVMNINMEQPDGPPTQIAVKATRIVYRAGTFSCLHVKTRVGGTDFDLRCQAPFDRFLEFRELFVLVSHSLLVLGPTMSALAANKPSPDDLAG
jgi:hypothetical protein